MCAEGQAHINSIPRPNDKNDSIPRELVGPCCESILEVCGVSTRVF
jgi:hypothetical protein